jgi:hypothetical protein
MTFVVDALRFVNVFAAAIVGGGLVAILLVVVPVKRTLPARQSVEIHLAMLGHQIDRYMKPSGILSGLTGLALLGLLPEHTLARVVPLVLGLLGTVGVVITSRYFNVRSNRAMAGWNLDALPPGYPEWRDRWDRIHAIRTSCGLVALASYLLSALTR